MTDKIPEDKTLLLSNQTGGLSKWLKMSTLILLLILVAFFSIFHVGVKSTNMNQGGVPYGIRRGSHSRNHASVSDILGRSTKSDPEMPQIVFESNPVGPPLLTSSHVNRAPSATRPARLRRGTGLPEITPPSSSPTWAAARWSTLTCTARCGPCTRRSTGPGTPPSLSRPRSSRGSGERSWPSQERLRALR